MEKPVEVVCQCHQRPFRTHILDTAQAEAPESEGLFDDPENRLNGLFAQGVEFASLLCLKAMLHPLLGAGFGARRGRIRPLLELLDGTPMGLASGRRVDQWASFCSARLFDCSHDSGALIPAVYEHRLDTLNSRAHGRRRRPQPPFVIGRIAHVYAYQQAALDFHGGFRVVTLSKTVRGLPDPTLRGGKVELVLVPRPGREPEGASVGRLVG